VKSAEVEERESKRVKFDSAAKPPALDGIAAAEPEPIDEEAEIERRRRERQAKREALLNKTKPSALLTQALNVPTPADSVPATPPMDTPSRESRQGQLRRESMRNALLIRSVVTPNTSAPPTPHHDSAPNSPMRGEDLAKELARLGDDDGEEQSAAMYDPNMDVDEDRVRHEAERAHNGEVSASAYDETQEEGRKDVLIPETVEPQEAPKKAGGDMFADESDEDDDMFAATDKPFKPTAATKAVPVPAQGRALAADLHDNWDTPDGFYKTIVGELIDSRYIVKAALGKGVFATVIRAQDTETGKLVAIKIVRNNEAMRKAGMKEIDILQKLAQADADDHFHVVRMYRHFTHKNHLCMVFENLNSNLRDLVKSYGRKTGLELQVVKSYAVQMFKALVLLRKCEILHADLKPDNILNDTGSGKKIKIADLGSATAASDNEITPYLASRFYRAPEVMLGIPPQYPIDMWAIGCTLFELYTDAILFAGKSNNEMLKAMQECRGKLSKKVIRRGTDSLKYAHFDANLDLFGSVERSGIPPKDTVRWINFGSQPVGGKDIKTRLLRAASKKGTTKPEQLKELGDFAELLDKCLKLDPEERLTPRQALAHRFCSGKSAATAVAGAGAGGNGNRY
jgi:serine/threonine-protein kinase PRP4